MDILICLTLNLDYEVKDKKEKLHRASLFVFIWTLIFGISLKLFCSCALINAMKKLNVSGLKSENCKNE